MHHLHHFRLSPESLIFLGIFLLFVASQVFWILKIRRWKQRLLESRKLKLALDVLGAIIYVALLAYGFAGARRTPSPTRLTLTAAFLEAPWLWWLFGSLIGFAFYLLVKGCGLLIRIFLLPFRWRARRKSAALQAQRSGNTNIEAVREPEPANPARRHFLERTATLVGAVPFAMGAYGVFIGRLNLKVTHPRIVLPRLPAAFEGFRILQLSDLHIGPFMTAREIRKVVEISNRLQPDLAVLTGDYVTWDASTQYAVVDALSGLKAQHGVYGCLGNHEIYTHTQASITRLFAAQGFRILRQEQAVIQQGQDFINLIGVDFESQRNFGREGRGRVRRYLEGVDRLMIPGVNILLSHNPNTFDRAAQLGIDLSLAGHTHGGQVALEFLDVDLSPARLITPYVRGWFKKGRGQLYVNRGIGTIAVPMRFCSPPEITVYHLTRYA
ncbi:MAG TPA: metallophosphoesterase [Terriglobia bacterium]|nr:metallophosphoesterase [Terriglobia bacterium]